MIRVAGASALALAVLLAAGCALTVAEDEGQSVTEVGRDAADIARARVRVLEDEIDILQKQQKELEHRREELLKDADNYREHAARAWTDPSLGDSERAAHAKQYRALAEEREKQAARCAELMRAYDARIASLENKRRNVLREAAEFDRMKVPTPR